MSLNSAFSIIVTVFLLSACVSNGYRIDRQEMDQPQLTSGSSSMAEMPEAPSTVDDEQAVTYSLSPDFDRDPPACAVIRASDQASAKSVIAKDVEQAVAIHLGGKLNRVIGARQRERILRKQRLDLDHTGDARAFAWKTHCRAILSWRLTAANESFFLAYGTRKVGLELTLKRIGKKDILWQARHATSRADGGLPLSPIGLVMDTFRAGRFMADRDMLASMIHDVVRRLFITLPETL